MLDSLLGLFLMFSPAQYIDAAIHTCPNAIKTPDRSMLERVLEAEKAAGWPDRLRGASLAAACRESGFNPRAEGDCRSGVCMAHGLLQLWPWAQRRYGIDRKDPVASARVWSVQIARTVKKAKRKGCKRPWVTAWAWVASGPKGWSCNRSPRHYRQLKKMKRAMRYSRGKP